MESSFCKPMAQRFCGEFEPAICLALAEFLKYFKSSTIKRLCRFLQFLANHPNSWQKYPMILAICCLSNLFCIAGFVGKFYHHYTSYSFELSLSSPSFRLLKTGRQLRTITKGLELTSTTFVRFYWIRDITETFAACDRNRKVLIEVSLRFVS